MSGKAMFLFSVLAAAVVAAPVDAQTTPHEPVVDMIALLGENQDRCLNIARETLTVLQTSYDEGERQDGLSDLVKDRLAGEIAVSREALSILAGLMRKVGTKLGIGKILSQMLDAQEDLCTKARSTSHRSDPSVFEDAIARLLARYSAAEANLEIEITLSASARANALWRYRSQLEAARRTAVESERYEEESEDWAHEQVVASDRPLSPKEFRKQTAEYKEWEAEQERQRQAKLRREADLRRQRKEKLEQQKNAPDLKVGYTREAPPPEPEVDPAVQAAFETWHKVYAQRIQPLKIAISRYIQVKDSPATSQRLMSACSKLKEAAMIAKDDTAILSTPSAELSTVLKNSFVSFSEGAEACLFRDEAKRKTAVGEAEKNLGAAAKILHTYSLGL